MSSNTKPLDSLLDRQAKPTELSFQLMAFFKDRIGISRPEMTRLALGISLSDPAPPELVTDPGEVYEAFKDVEESKPIRIRTVFGDDSWRIWGSMIRLHANETLTGKELVERLVEHWERGLVRLREDWRSTGNRDALLGRLLNRVGELHARESVVSSPLTLESPLHSKAAVQSGESQLAEIKMITRESLDARPDESTTIFRWPSPFPIPLAPFARLPDEDGPSAANRLAARLDLGKRTTAALAELLDTAELVDLEMLTGLKKAVSPQWLKIAARQHLFWTKADGSGSFDLEQQPWLIDLSRMTASAQKRALMLALVGVENLCRQRRAARGSVQLRLRLDDGAALHCRDLAAFDALENGAASLGLLLTTT